MSLFGGERERGRGTGDKRGRKERGETQRLVCFPLLLTSERIMKSKLAEVKG